MSDHRIMVTDLELTILQKIWALDNLATVNDVIEHWSEPTPPGYTTVLKTLQKMEEKDIVGHQSQGRKYAYFANVTKEQVAGKRLTTIVDRVFSGSSLSFAQFFIKSQEFDASELKALKKLIAEKEKETKK